MVRSRICRRSLLLTLLLAPALACAQVITTAVGTSWVFRDDGKPALNAALGFLQAVAVDSAGNIYASDIGNHRVVRISPSGTLTVIAGNGIQWFSGDGGPGASASVNTPSGLAVDANGNVYLADQESHRIRKVSPAGIITTVAGSGEPGFSGDNGPATRAQLNFPFGVALGRDGSIYISERHNHRVRRVSPSGIITTFAGTGADGFSGDNGPATSAQLSEPRGLAVDSSDNLYIADAYNARIRKVAPAGTISTVAGDGAPRFGGDNGPATSASLEFPNGVLVDGAGNIYIADTVNHRIRRVAAGSGIITTVVGNGSATFAGDSGPAGGASLNYPSGVALDAAGNLYIADFGNQRVRRVAGGTISTVAGNGAFKYSGDGAAATSASLDVPMGVAVDSRGNLYIADAQNHRVRRVNAATGVITTVAGNGVQGFGGDNGPAASAQLDEPRGVAVDANDNIYIADKGNFRVRRVSAAGTITTVAGGGNAFPGDNGPATSAQISAFGVALDRNNNLFIADRANHRIRMVSVSSGVITTVAGGGTVFPGDGGPATSAALNNPAAVAVDASGNIYIADTLSNRIRRVTSGTITTFAGNGTFGFSGDGGPATSAMLTEPAGVTVDAAGNVFIADYWNARIRRVTPSGVISTVAGGGSSEQFAGDGGPATGAGLSLPASVALDAAGNIYIADSNNDRIRRVLASAPAFALSPASLSLSAPSGAPSVAAQQIAVTSTVTGLGWTALAATQTGGAWLSVSPETGGAPGVLEARVNVAQLAPGTYRGTVTVQVPLASPQTLTVSVELTVSQALAPKLSVEPDSINFQTQAGAGDPAAATVQITNAGGGSLDWTAQVETTSGGGWLRVSSTSGSAGAGSPAAVQISASVAGLAPGVYSGRVRVESPTTGQRDAMAVSLLITQATQTILVSQSGLLFTGVEGAGTVPSQSFGILNTGQGGMNWTVRARTFAGGNWLSLSPASGRSDAGSVQVPQVEVAVNATGLRAGQYSGLIQVDASGADNSPQFVTVELTVLPRGSNPGVSVRPTGLVFAAQAGTSSPSSQTVRLATASSAGVEARTGVLTSDGGNWVQLLPPNVVISPNDPGTITVQPRVVSLLPGVYRAVLTFLFLDGSPTQTVNILFLVTPPEPRALASGGPLPHGRGSEPRASAAGAAFASAQQCAPQRLLAVHRTLVSNFSSPVGWPSPIEVQVADDCGNAIPNATVVASFTNGDPPLSMVTLRNGLYLGTWRPLVSSAEVTVTVRAERPGLVAAVLQTRGRVGENAAAPVLFSGGIVSAASFVRAGPLAPGAIVSAFGRSLARGNNVATRLPLETTLGGATLNVGGVDVPLFYTGEGQINAQLPFDLRANTRPQVLVRTSREGAETVSVPESVTIAAVQPAIFTMNQQGTGQGAIVDTRGRVVDSNAPAARGEGVQVFCTGLGITNPVVRSGEPAPAAEPLARVVAPVEAQVGGRPARVLFAGLAPGFVGLYQVNVEIPEGVTPGPEVPLVLIQGGVPSNTVTLAIR